MSADMRTAVIVATSGFSSKLGKMIDVTEEGTLWTLSPTSDLIGNPVVRALHGGAVTAFLELACGVVLARQLDHDSIPRLISMNVQFLASMRLAPVIARPQVRRIGRRVAVAQIEAWQDSPDTVVCAAQCEFLCEFA
ncbi:MULTISPECIES: PaaI family thioesterase [Sphingomonadales]|nr:MULTISPECIES: PaaI family thioesterase [Sphingomonadaceae]MAM84662.1 hypothetical protein [Acidobacteriota bacterium]MBN2972880.1 PaaI family thioesterase [Roseomonas aeriglobus]MBY0300148.1 PaaI family thioesterase [Sphingomonas ginsenosidimutans]MDV3480916.1 PaaI family thioesterase [Sphingobium yanoikuyae]TKV44059.1 hypothetical protein A0U87_10275 [Sphingobium sp. MP9-4]